LLGLLLLVYLLVQTKPVQNWLVNEASSRLSNDLGTTVTITHVDFSLFDKMLLEGTYVQDKHKDTLLYAGKLKLRITDWFFLRDSVTLQYIGLEDAYINLHRVDTVWNYQFLVDYFSGPPSGKKKKGIELMLQQVEMDNIHLQKRDEWRGEDQALYLRRLNLQAREINFTQKKIAINTLSLVEPVFSIYNYTGKRKAIPPSVKRNPADTTLHWNPDGWQVYANLVTIENGVFKSDKKTDRSPYYYFDGQHILFGHINSSFKDLRFLKDTLSASIAVATKERSGFEVKMLKANFKMQPQAMEFTHLNIHTGKSHLTDFFAMRYDDFDDLGDFIDKVRMQGIFRNATLHSDDIAFFAPELQKWNREIHLTGTIHGTVANLFGRGLQLQAGKNTLLNGDISIKGLPDIDKTYIDFKSNEFRTTYPDAVALIPALREINPPHLEQFQYLRFTGNFTGFIRNFVTYGKTETALGNLETDINMRFPEKGLPAYAGKIKTDAFNLGSFVGNSQLGKIAFNGAIKGSGLTLNSLQSSLDGRISTIEFNDYAYHNISVKGAISKRMFNGNLVADDPNAGITLNGLVDFSKKEPRFDFNAVVDRINLKRLKLYNQDIDFNGNFKMNFTGSNIDNFLGNARVYNASIFKNGHRISFDSLTIESRTIEDSKSIVVVSNEFDAALVGEYSIHELPGAFQAFLNRYYPSYIRPSSRKLSNENFSFVITTRKVDDYMDFFDKSLGGFNNMNLSGRINTRENLFDLDAEVPQFSYKNIAFGNVNIQGRGNMDSLKLNTGIGDIFVNDSLHFPGTKISVRAANDISKVNISTSANQTLNAASVSGTVHTMQNGFSVLFEPSTFDINGKTWTIDKNGELTLSRKIISTDGLKIYSGDQEIRLTSQPSDISNSTDLDIDLKKINIGDFAPFFVKSNRLEGLLSGNVAISDPFGNTNVDVKANAEQFRLDDDSVGRLQITTAYTKSGGRVTLGIISENNNYHFDLNGFINVADSTGTGIDITAHLNDKTNIHILERYLSGIFSNLQGYAAGDLRIAGKGSNLKYTGNLTLTDGGLTVDYTKCRYHIPQAKVQLLEDRVDFGSFVLTDDLGNKAELQTGKLYHNNFKDMAFDFRIKTNRLLLLNTTIADNKEFYGRVIGKADFSFKGPQEDMLLELTKAEPVDSSVISLPITSGRVNSEADFLSWKVYGKEMQPSKMQKAESNLNVILHLTANPLMTINVILDEAAGDQISAIGKGTMEMKAGTRENLSMNGRFDIDRGNYTFNFQSIKRRFKLREGAGNYIKWSGDPYDADLKVTGEYIAENVRFSDLGINSKGTIYSVLNEQVKRYRGDVLVTAKITDKLKNPKIQFDIELPPYSQLANDPDATALLQLIRRDENELNKQVSLLVVFNSFGPLSSTSNTSFNVGKSALEGIVVNSISGVISSQLTRQFSNILQTVFKDPSIRVNVNASVYSGSNLSDVTNQTSQFLDRTNLNFTVNKSYFNERLTFIVGSALDFGINNSSATSARNSFQFLPDVTAQLKLTPDGKFLLNFFYRQNTNYGTYGGTGIGKQSRSGVSVSYRKEFENFGDLLKKKK
jgi:hypothetical protein